MYVIIIAVEDVDNHIRKRTAKTGLDVTGMEAQWWHYWCASFKGSHPKELCLSVLCAVSASMIIAYLLL